VGKGYTLTSKADAEGAEPITYQWYENSSPIGSGTAALAITAGQTVANNYTYVRVASNAECPDGIASNTYTVQVRAAGAAGEPATCGCVSGLIPCSSTCTTPKPTEVDGACVTGACRQRTVIYYTTCGVPTGSSGTRTDDACLPYGEPALSGSCNENQDYLISAILDAAACQALALVRARNACARYYNYIFMSGSNRCTQSYCN
jgi:hypothetical protein